MNRLLLPAHAECVRAVGLGLAPALADRAAATGLLGVAPLALAESVGRRTIRAALANYAAATTHTDDYRQLILAVAAEAHEAPTGSGAAAGMDLAEACDIQQAVQLNTCLNFVQDGLIGVRDLDWLLTHYYGGTETLAAYLERCDRQALTARLQSLQRQTGRQYFVPAAALAGH